MTPGGTRGAGGTVVRRAPGKLFVAGEYAVVDPGNPAILVAVDRYVTVTVSELPGTGVEFTSDLGPRAVRLRWHGARLGTHDGPGAPAGLAHVVAATETVARLLAEHGLPVPGFSLRVDSALHDNGTKYGLGSSGAVTVAAVAAVAAFCGLRLPPEDRFKLALLATAEIDPRASGGDLAASTWGGWIAYQAPDRAAVRDLARRHGVQEALRAPWPHFAARRLPAPAGLSLEVGWTGTPASTAALVRDLDRRTWRGSASHRTFVETTTDCVHACAAALEQGDRQSLLEQIRRARRELARLDDEVGLGIFTPPLTALCDAAEAAGGAAKPSGAGGGDCGIALLDAETPRDIDQVRERWATAGVLPLPVRPAVEGNEE
ncbi:phosphomevalonate kinase [Streptomyces sp. NBC_00080]|uniref:phosphomevalonate kinase n=1 Tax=unclassified Streptomyces TaxID=2593676 RepID=UPI00114D704E|nr:phosphomevalonate kinase [Streptomyces sp. SLBN-115]TQJ37138.1 phosphomevalonate kinase [Streptomyces sp. SLBN-115]